MKYQWSYTVNGERDARIFATRRAAASALAAWSLLRYELTGNFDHDATAKIVRVY